MNYLTTELGASPVIVEGIFPVSAHIAFEAWTNAEEIPQWFGSAPNSMQRAEIDLKVGGKWRFIFEETEEKTVSLEGEYLEITENEKLVFSWIHVVRKADGDVTSTETSTVTLLFRESSAGTEITLNHKNIGSKDSLLGVGNGWENTFTSFGKIVAKI